MIELRELGENDWRIWREVRLAALAEAPHAFRTRLAEWQGDGDREERWRARLAIPGAVDFVAVVDGRPAGMASGVPEGTGARVISVWVATAARGRGVGDLLLDAVERWAVLGGVEELRLGVFSGSEHALALYRRRGFLDAGEMGDPLPDGRREVALAKRLTC
ncbi:GNAT family N-acetyltransferase [Streptomyces mayteni]